jgi:hypothetical protein
LGYQEVAVSRKKLSAIIGALVLSVVVIGLTGSAVRYDNDTQASVRSEPGKGKAIHEQETTTTLAPTTTVAPVTVPVTEPPPVVEPAPEPVIQAPVADPAPAPVVEVDEPEPYVAQAGAHSDAWWQGVSICEQGGRNDPFFGYFSIMDGSAGGLPWGVQVAMANNIIARAGDGAWAASCVAMGYAHSPSG